MKLFTALALLSLTACGEGPSSGDEKADQATDRGADPEAAGMQHSMFVSDSASLPECTPEAEGWLIYVKADGKFQACSTGAWAAIDLAPLATRVVSTIACTAPLDGIVYGATLIYRASVMSTGDVFVTTNVSADIAGQNGDSAYFAAKQKDADTAPLAFDFDVEGAANGGAWTISLDRKALVLSALYRDDDITGLTKKWELKESCKVTEAK